MRRRARDMTAGLNMVLLRRRVCWDVCWRSNRTGLRRVCSLLRGRAGLIGARRSVLLALRLRLVRLVLLLVLVWLVGRLSLIQLRCMLLIVVGLLSVRPVGGVAIRMRRWEHGTRTIGYTCR
jgi:hypothetical protein